MTRGQIPVAWRRPLRQAIWRLGTYLEQTRRPLIVALTIVMTIGLGAIDVATGDELSFSIFYLGSVGVAAWLTIRSIAYGIASLSAATWFWADHLAGAAYSHPSIPYWNASVRLGFFVIVAELLLSLRSHLQNEQLLARTDPLTGVANPRAFLEALDGELYRARRYGRPLSLAYVDLDDFKQVNDKLGHSGGDEMLRFVAEHVEATVRASDVVGRLGGDEFAILLPETDADAAHATAEKIRRLLHRAMDSAPIAVTLSMGVVTFDSPPTSADDAISMADRLMYDVKVSGKDDVGHLAVGAQRLETQSMR
ncbi:MAG: GGDEF domain-containing protein [Actinomycetota bacterium]|nr:GGDEF domain-containing protein [Actinomycetota bacterium]